MKLPRELEIQEEVIRNLGRYELYPFSVICSFAGSLGDGIIAITFYMKKDLEDFLRIIDYDNQCDKSGYCVIKDNNTIILGGLGLMNFYTTLLL